MIIALGEKVFGALLVITGAAIILTGHWTKSQDGESARRLRTARFAHCRRRGDRVRT